MLFWPFIYSCALVRVRGGGGQVSDSGLALGVQGDCMSSGAFVWRLMQECGWDESEKMENRDVNGCSSLLCTCGLV